METALYRVYEVNFGLYGTEPLYDVNGWISAFYIYSITLVLVILMINVFLAIVMNAWFALEEAEKEQRNAEKQYLHGGESRCWKTSFQVLFLTDQQLLTVIDAAKSLPLHESVTLSDLAMNLKQAGLSDDSVVSYLAWFWNRANIEEVLREGRLFKKGEEASTTKKAIIQTNQLAPIVDEEPSNVRSSPML